MKSRRPSANAEVPLAAPKIPIRRKRKESTKEKWLYPSATTTLEVTLPNEWLPEIDHALARFFPVLREREDFLYRACEYVLSGLEEEKEKAKADVRAKRKGGKK